MTKANYVLRLQAQLENEAKRVAKAAGTTLNQRINVAVAEQLSAPRTADYFRDRGGRADIARALACLDHAGDQPPPEGDALPPGLPLGPTGRT